MLHEYRDPQGSGICAGCGRAYRLCRGIKRLDDALAHLIQPGDTVSIDSVYQPNPELARDVARLMNARPEEYLSVMGEHLPIDVVQGRGFARLPGMGFVPVTGDMLRRTEELVARVALLRLEAMDDGAHQDFYQGWRAYDEALASESQLQRDANCRAEVVELERLWHLR